MKPRQRLALITIVVCGLVASAGAQSPAQQPSAPGHVHYVKPREQPTPTGPSRRGCRTSARTCFRSRRRTSRRSGSSTRA